jgi:hypothetical protein
LGVYLNRWQKLERTKTKNQTNQKQLNLFIMNKQLLSITLFMLVLFNSFGQDSGDFELGGNIGLNIGNVSTIDNQSNASSRIAFNIGISGEYYFSDRWGLKTKLIYDSKGWSDGFITDENLDIFSTDFILSYVTLPIMANWHFGSTRNWYLNFGPYIGFLTSAKDSELDLDLKDGFASTDFGLALGIGYKFEISDKAKLFFEFDGQSGFTDIFEMNDGDAIRNIRSSLNLGILFNL